MTSNEASKKNSNMSVFDRMKMARELRREDVASSRWLKFRKIHYVHAKGDERTWECIERTTTVPGTIDAVEIIAFFNNEKGERCIVLERQYRVPIGSVCVEFPAGLINKGETAEEAAKRELKEECGLLVKSVTSISDTFAYEPSLTNETGKFVVVEAELVKGQEDTDFDDDELIETLIIPLKELSNRIESLKKEGCIIDGKVFSFVLATKLFGSGANLFQTN